MGMKVPHGDTNALEYHMKDGTLAALGNVQQYVTPWLVLLASMKVHEDKMLQRARSGYSAATELANEIVRCDGLDYRTAHDVCKRSSSSQYGEACLPAKRTSTSSRQQRRRLLERS
jgi:argininosuccinate lyase